MKETPAAAWRRRAVLFWVGALGYCTLELLWRGYTHWSMGLTGGLCLVGLYGLHRRLKAKPLAVQALAGAALITAAEFCVGCVVNLLLGWNVWDYSGWHIQLLGQICLVFCLLWYLLCLGVFLAFRLLERQRARRGQHRHPDPGTAAQG